MGLDATATRDAVGLDEGGGHEEEGAGNAPPTSSPRDHTADRIVVLDLMSSFQWLERRALEIAEIRRRRGQERVPSWASALLGHGRYWKQGGASLSGRWGTHHRISERKDHQLRMGRTLKNEDAVTGSPAALRDEKIRQPLSQPARTVHQGILRNHLRDMALLALGHASELGSPEAQLQLTRSLFAVYQSEAVRRVLLPAALSDETTEAEGDVIDDDDDDGHDGTTAAAADARNADWVPRPWRRPSRRRAATRPDGLSFTQEGWSPHRSTQVHVVSVYPPLGGPTAAANANGAVEESTDGRAGEQQTLRQGASKEEGSSAPPPDWGRLPSASFTYALDDAMLRRGDLPHKAWETPGSRRPPRVVTLQRIPHCRQHFWTVSRLLAAHQGLGRRRMAIPRVLLTRYGKVALPPPVEESSSTTVSTPISDWLLMEQLQPLRPRTQPWRDHRPPIPSAAAGHANGPVFVDASALTGVRWCLVRVKLMCEALVRWFASAVRSLLTLSMLRRPLRAFDPLDADFTTSFEPSPATGMAWWGLPTQPGSRLGRGEDTKGHHGGWATPVEQAAVLEGRRRELERTFHAAAVLLLRVGGGGQSGGRAALERVKADDDEGNAFIIAEATWLAPLTAVRYERLRTQMPLLANHKRERDMEDASCIVITSSTRPIGTAEDEGRQGTIEVPDHHPLQGIVNDITDGVVGRLLERGLATDTVSGPSRDVVHSWTIHRHDLTTAHHHRQRPVSALPRQVRVDRMRLADASAETDRALCLVGAPLSSGDEEVRGEGGDVGPLRWQQPQQQQEDTFLTAWINGPCDAPVDGGVASFSSSTIASGAGTAFLEAQHQQVFEFSKYFFPGSDGGGGGGVESPAMALIGAWLSATELTRLTVTPEAAALATQVAFQIAGTALPRRYGTTHQQATLQFVQRHHNIKANGEQGGREVKETSSSSSSSNTPFVRSAVTDDAGPVGDGWRSSPPSLDEPWYDTLERFSSGTDPEGAVGGTHAAAAAAGDDDREAPPHAITELLVAVDFALSSAPFILTAMTVDALMTAIHDTLAWIGACFYWPSTGATESDRKGIGRLVQLIGQGRVTEFVSAILGATMDAVDAVVTTPMRRLFGGGGVAAIGTSSHPLRRAEEVDLKQNIPGVDAAPGGGGASPHLLDWIDAETVPSGKRQRHRSVSRAVLISMSQEARRQLNTEIGVDAELMGDYRVKNSLDPAGVERRRDLDVDGFRDLVEDASSSMTMAHPPDGVALADPLAARRTGLRARRPLRRLRSPLRRPSSRACEPGDRYCDDAAFSERFDSHPSTSASPRRPSTTSSDWLAPWAWRFASWKAKHVHRLVSTALHYLGARDNTTTVGRASPATEMPFVEGRLPWRRHVTVGMLLQSLRFETLLAVSLSQGASVHHRQAVASQWSVSTSGAEDLTWYSLGAHRNYGWVLSVLAGAVEAEVAAATRRTNKKDDRAGDPILATRRQRLEKTGIALAETGADHLWQCALTAFDARYLQPTMLQRDLTPEQVVASEISAASIRRAANSRQTGGGEGGDKKSIFEAAARQAHAATCLQLLGMLADAAGVDAAVETTSTTFNAAGQAIRHLPMALRRHVALNGGLFGWRVDGGAYPKRRAALSRAAREGRRASKARDAPATAVGTLPGMAGAAQCLDAAFLSLGVARLADDGGPVRSRLRRGSFAHHRRLYWDAATGDDVIAEGLWPHSAQAADGGPDPLPGPLGQLTRRKGPSAPVSVWWALPWTLTAVARRSLREAAGVASSFQSEADEENDSVAGGKFGRSQRSGGASEKHPGFDALLYLHRRVSHSALRQLLPSALDPVTRQSSATAAVGGPRLGLRDDDDVNAKQAAVATSLFNTAACLHLSAVTAAQSSYQLSRGRQLTGDSFEAADVDPSGDIGDDDDDPEPISDTEGGISPASEPAADHNNDDDDDDDGASLAPPTTVKLTQMSLPSVEGRYALWGVLRHHWLRAMSYAHLRRGAAFSSLRTTRPPPPRSPVRFLIQYFGGMTSAENSEAASSMEGGPSVVVGARRAETAVAGGLHPLSFGTPFLSLFCDAGRLASAFSHSLTALHLPNYRGNRDDDDHYVRLLSADEVDMAAWTDVDGDAAVGWSPMTSETSAVVVKDGLLDWIIHVDRRQRFLLQQQRQTDKKQTPRGSARPRASQHGDRGTPSDRRVGAVAKSVVLPYRSLQRLVDAHARLHGSNHDQDDAVDLLFNLWTYERRDGGDVLFGDDRSDSDDGSSRSPAGSSADLQYRIVPRLGSRRRNVNLIMAVRKSSVAPILATEKPSTVGGRKPLINVNQAASQAEAEKEEVHRDERELSATRDDPSKSSPRVRQHDGVKNSNAPTTRSAQRRRDIDGDAIWSSDQYRLPPSPAGERQTTTTTSAAKPATSAAAERQEANQPQHGHSKTATAGQQQPYLHDDDVVASASQAEHRATMGDAEAITKSAEELVKEDATKGKDAKAKADAATDMIEEIKRRLLSQRVVRQQQHANEPRQGGQDDEEGAHDDLRRRRRAAPLDERDVLIAMANELVADLGGPLLACFVVCLFIGWMMAVLRAFRAVARQRRLRAP